MSKCPSCEKVTLIRDKNFCEVQLVCNECGIVVADTIYENDINLEGTSYVSDNKFGVKTSKFKHRIPNSIYRCLKTPSLPAAVQVSMHRLEYLASELHLNKSLTEELKSMHLKVLSQKAFERSRLPTKIVVVVVCAYILVRQNGWAMSVKHLCKLLQCEVRMFSHVYKQVKEILGISAPHVPLKDSLEQHLSHINFREEKDKVIPLAKNIFRVIVACNYSCRSAPKSISLVIAYLAWKQIHWGEQALLYKDFATKFDIATKPSYKATKEVETILTDLISNIPWLYDVKVDKHNIAKYIEELVSYPSPASLKPQPVERQVRDGPQSSSTGCVKFFNEQDTIEEEISDTEISSYIRSDAEVVALKALKKKLLGFD